MPKPKRLYRVETKHGPGQYTSGYSPKRTFAQRKWAENQAEFVRKHGGEAQIFFTDCNWKPIEEET